MASDRQKAVHEGKLELMSKDKRERREKTLCKGAEVSRGSWIGDNSTLFFLYSVSSVSFVRIFSKFNFSINISGAGPRTGYSSSLLLS